MRLHIAPSPEASPAQQQPEMPNGELHTDLLQALHEFCDAYEDSGYGSMVLGSAYLKAKRILRQVEGR